MENFINKDLDYDKCAEEYKKNNKIFINNILKKEYAELLHKYLTNQKKERWELCAVYNNKKYEAFDTSKNKKTNDSVIKKAVKSFENNEFSFVFYKILNTKYPLSFTEYNVKKIFSENNFIELLNHITNENLTKMNDIFISKYSKDCFLSPHCDKQNGKIAVTIYLTKNWKPHYGGNLCFLNNKRNKIIETLTPNFNSIAIFNIPDLTGIPHFVSHNNSYKSRYTLTMWYS